MLKIKNTRTNEILVERMYKADTIFTKMKGLLGRKDMSFDEGMLICGARQIHMFFMKFAIDVIFLDKNFRIIKIYRRFKPFRISGYFLKAKYVLELKSGILDEKDTQVGDVLEIFE